MSYFVKKLKIIGIILVVLVAIGLVTFTVDTNRAKNEKKPIFAISLDHLKDGGSEEFIGLGYKMTYFHKITCRDGEFYEGIHYGSWFTDVYSMAPRRECTEEDYAFNLCLDGIDIEDDEYTCEMLKDELESVCEKELTAGAYYCKYGMRDLENN